MKKWIGMLCSFMAGCYGPQAPFIVTGTTPWGTYSSYPNRELGIYCSCGDSGFCRCPGFSPTIYVGNHPPSPTPRFYYVWCPGGIRHDYTSTAEMRTVCGF